LAEWLFLSSFICVYKLASDSRPIVRSNSSPAVIKYFEDLDFDEDFELSLFRTKSESALDTLVLDPDFAAVINLERHNKVVESFILRHIQSSVHATTLVDFLENISDHIGSTINHIENLQSSHTAHQASFPFISISPIVTFPDTPPGSPSSHTPHTPSSPSSPQTSLPLITTPVIILPPPPPQAPSTPPPPRTMAARFAPLVLPANLHDMPADYQSKIPMFDGTP